MREPACVDKPKRTHYTVLTVYGTQLRIDECTMYGSRKAQLRLPQPRLNTGLTGVAFGTGEGGRLRAPGTTPTPAPPSPSGDMRRPSIWVSQASNDAASDFARDQAREQAKAQLQSITGRMFQVLLKEILGIPISS